MVATRMHLSAWLLLCLFTACAPVTPASRGAPASVADDPSGPPKSLVIGILVSIKGYGPWEFSSTGGGGASVAEIHTVGLVSEDQNGRLQPRLAAKLPSIDDGTIAVLPDGRMRTTWQLRPGVTWHDGTPLTAHDLAFSADLNRHPEFVTSLNPGILRAETAEARDASTLVITWKTTFHRALHLGHRDFWPYPRHLLEEAFEDDKQRFLALKYFTTEYVHLGPFRLVDYGLGEQQVFERYDGYYLGRPKIHTVTIRTISNVQALVAGFKAGSIDIVAEKTLPGDLAAELRDEWESSAEGVLLSRQDNWLYGAIQFGRQWARPEELSQDVRIRRALYQAIDRVAIREVMLPGFPDTNGDTFMPRGDPRAATVGLPFARYRYDPAASAQELAQAGWRKGPDGRLVNHEGRQVQIEIIAANDTWTKEVALIADSWRQLGIDATEVIPSRAVARDDERMASYPGVILRARSSAESVFAAFDSRLQALPHNRYAGANMGRYANPELDHLIDTLYGTIDERQQALLLKDMGEIIAADLPAMPIYFRTTFAVVRKGVHALTDDYASTRDTGVMARHAHLWDRS